MQTHNAQNIVYRQINCTSSFIATTFDINGRDSEWDNANIGAGCATTQHNLKVKMKVNHFNQKKSPKEFYFNWKCLNNTQIIALGLI